MAKITIPPCALEEMLDDTAEVVITSFSWNKHMRNNEPDFEFELKVNQNYEYETDEVVLVEEFQELETAHNQLKDDYDKLMAECNAAQTRIELGNTEYDELNAKYKALLAAATPKPKWLFWKK
jgi:hypothetical protein